MRKGKGLFRTAVVTVVLALALVALLAGCQQREAAAERPAADARPGEGMYFRLVTHGGDDPFWAVVQQGMRDAAEELGARADIALSGGDLSRQLRDFQDAVASNPDGIALVINDESAWDQPVQDALDQGVPVAGINSDGSANNPRLFYIGQDEIAASRTLAEAVFSKAQADGVDMANAHVAFAAEVPGASYAQTRAAGVRQAMEEYGITSFEMIDAGGLEMSVVESRMASYLTANPQTTFLLGAGGICTDRLMSSLQAAGRRPGEVYAGGFDAAPGTLEGINAGYVIASIDQQQYLQGYFAVYGLYLYNKFGLTPNVDTGGYLITEATAGLIQDLSGVYR